MTKNILIVGVGGQGTLLASRILGCVAQKQNYDVKVSEVHGMSQRGGSVITYVKYGDKVASPVIGRGEADIILAFEELEAYRAIGCLKKDGTVLVNTQNIDPMPVITGVAQYPGKILEKLQSMGADCVAVNAFDYAAQAGNAKSVNVVLIGVLANRTGIAKEVWLEAIKETVPPKFLDVNLKAFELGYNHQ